MPARQEQRKKQAREWVGEMRLCLEKGQIIQGLVAPVQGFRLGVL